MATETADSLEAGHCELEAAVARDRTRGLPTLRSSTLILGCGIGASSQAALVRSQARSNGSREQALSLAAKTTFVAPEAGRAGCSLAYGLSSVKASGSAWRTETLDLVSLVTREPAPGLLVHANLGHRARRAVSASTRRWRCSSISRAHAA